MGYLILAIIALVFLSLGIGAVYGVYSILAPLIGLVPSIVIIIMLVIIAAIVIIFLLSFFLSLITAAWSH